MNKYRNKPTMVDGIRFASKAEAKRYGELKFLENIGNIQDLRLQPRYPLRHDVSGALVGTYVGDFAYTEIIHGPQSIGERRVVEDVKGVETMVFKLKKKLFQYCYPGIELRVIRA